MQDERGIYYYPNVANKRFRTYVKEEGGQVWFRLYSADDPKLWEAHGWVPHGAIEKAAAQYSGNQFDPSLAYDLQLARALISENSKI
jgi:hypothetical protein